MYIYAGSNANPQPCKYYVELQRLAEPMFHDVQEYTTLDQFTSSQQSLLASYHELTERMETSDSLHFPGPISGRHKCLDSAYHEAYTRLSQLAILFAQEPQSSQPAQPPEPLRTLKDVVQTLAASSSQPLTCFPLGSRRRFRIWRLRSDTTKLRERNVYAACPGASGGCRKRRGYPGNS